MEPRPRQDTRGPGLGAREAPCPRGRLRGDPRGVPARRGPARPCGCESGKSLRLPRAATCGGPRDLAAGSAPVEVWERRAGPGPPGLSPSAGQEGLRGEPEFHDKPVKIFACVRAPPPLPRLQTSGKKATGRQAP